MESSVVLYQLVLLCRELGYCLHYVTTLNKLFIGQRAEAYIVCNIK